MNMSNGVYRTPMAFHFVFAQEQRNECESQLSAKEMNHGIR